MFLRSEKIYKMKFLTDGEKMTFGQLHKIIVNNDIPDDVHLMSDSGWECSATEMNGVYYDKFKKLIVFTQEGEPPSDSFSNWEQLYPKRVISQD